MIASVKKFLSPVLYPESRELARPWFIKYKTQDWVNGGFRYEKYVGLLNRVATVEERVALAEKYMEMMKSGEPLPNYQGLRSAPAVIEARQETSMVYCCNRFLNVAKAEGKDNATIIQYRSKFNKFFKWLQETGRERMAIGGLSYEEAEDFLLWLRTSENICNASINYYKSLLSQVWNGYRRHIVENPWKEIRARKTVVTHLKSYPPELESLIARTLPGYDKQLWLFLQCIYYCAIRPHQELRLLKLKHFDFENSVITVPAEIAKTDKLRVVNVYRKLTDQFIAAGYNQHDADEFIFSHHGCPGTKRVGKNYFGIKWNEYRKAFGIDSSYKLYGSKHTGGKKLTKAKNAQWTQEHFGHTDPSSTQSYIQDWGHKELQSLQTDYPEFSSVV